MKRTITVLIMIVICFWLFATSFSATGYGNTIDEAKANAINKLTQDIYVRVDSITSDYSTNTTDSSSQVFSDKTKVSSSITLAGLKYKDTGKTTGKDTSKGKYYCVVEITDESLSFYYNEMRKLASEINSLYSLTQRESNLRALDNYYTQIENYISEYDKYVLTLAVLNHTTGYPTYNNEITEVKINSNHKMILEKLIDQTVKSVNSSGDKSEEIAYLEQQLRNLIWVEEERNSFSNDISVFESIERVYDKEYKIGDVGPAGGIIFYINADDSMPWKYLEAATKDLNGKFFFGKNAKLSTSTSIGSGEANSETINSKNNSSNGKTAATACLEYEEGGFTDWFLPSRDELEIMVKNIKKNSSANLKKDNYWSSSAFTTSFAYGYSMTKGKVNTDSMSSMCYVRPIRAF